MVLLLIILIVLAVTGALTFVLKVALGVALGLFLGVALIGGLVAWRVRRRLFGPQPRWRRVSRSRIEVLDHPDDPYGDRRHGPLDDADTR
jgi:membrane protein implicated in regulation of membrane protease activity